MRKFIKMFKMNGKFTATQKFPSAFPTNALAVARKWVGSHPCAQPGSVDIRVHDFRTSGRIFMKILRGIIHRFQFL